MGMSRNPMNLRSLGREKEEVQKLLTVTEFLENSYLVGKV
jgi:hypothetical protein